jgi:hypothetical protein
MNSWQFWHAHPFIAWCALWLVWMIVPLVQLAVSLVSRLLRTVKVLARGWPPAHLDADGDWKPEPKAETTPTTLQRGEGG